MPHARMPRAILPHARMPQCYKLYCVCRIVLECRVVIFSSQNAIMPHCYSFILECRIVEVIVEVMGSMKLVSDLL